MLSGNAAEVAGDIQDAVPPIWQCSALLCCLFACCLPTAPTISVGMPSTVQASHAQCHIPHPFAPPMEHGHSRVPPIDPFGPVSASFSNLSLWVGLVFQTPARVHQMYPSPIDPTMKPSNHKPKQGMLSKFDFWGIKHTLHGTHPPVL